MGWGMVIRGMFYQPCSSQRRQIYQRCEKLSYKYESGSQALKCKSQSCSVLYQFKHHGVCTPLSSHPPPKTDTKDHLSHGVTCAASVT